MKKSILTVLFCSTSLLFLFGFTQNRKKESIKEAMYQLEKVYIPVYYYVHHENMTDAKTAMLPLIYEWNKFNDNFSKSKDTPDWQNRFIKMEEWINDLRNHINANHVEWSKVSLSHFRYELMDLRCRYYIPFYFDHLYNFEESWGIVRQIADDKMMCLYEWEEFERFVRLAKRDWAILEQERMPIDMLDLSEEELLKLMIKREKLNKMLREFKEVLSCGDQGGVQQKAKIIEDAYFDFLLPFSRINTETVKNVEL